MVGLQLHAGDGEYWVMTNRGYEPIGWQVGFELSLSYPCSPSPREGSISSKVLNAYYWIY